MLLEHTQTLLLAFALLVTRLSSTVMLVWNDILLVDCIVPVATLEWDLPRQLKNVNLV